MSALGALGAALTTIGGIRQDKRKDELLERLEKEKEQRADDRQIAREQREADRESQKPVGEGEVVTKPDGSMIRRMRNSNGKVIDERPLDKTEIDAYNRQVQKDTIGLDSLLADVGYKKALTNESNARASEAPLDRAYKQSQIDENNAQAERYRRDPSQTKPVDDSLGTLTNTLVKNMADIKDSYPNIDSATFRQIAEKSIIAAAKAGQDATVIFEDALRRYGKPRDPRAISLEEAMKARK